MKPTFSPHRLRVKKARLAHFWAKPSVLLTFKGLIAISLILGVYVVISQGAQQSFWLIPAVLLFMLWQWLEHDVADLPATLKTSDQQTLQLHDALDADVVRTLRQPDSIANVWQAVRGVEENAFFFVRFGLDVSYFDVHCHDQIMSTEPVWRRSVELAKALGEDRISAGMLTVAIAEALPNADEYLAHAHLEKKDLFNGLRWQQYIAGIRRALKERRNFGGIARDWTAGYTPVLSRLGVNISAQIQNSGGFMLRDIATHEETVTHMVRTLSQSRTGNLALIGDLGVGKTTLVHAFAHELLTQSQSPANIRYHQIIRLDATSILSNTSPDYLEPLLVRILNEAYKAKNIILFLDDAALFFNQGTGSIDASNVLLPVLEHGSVRMILAMTPIEWQQIVAHKPALASYASQVSVKQPGRDEVIKIFEDQVLFMEYDHKVRYTYQALLEAYRLADHYISEGAFPGKGLSLLEAAATQAENGFVTERSVQSSVETTRGVKVQVASQDEKQQLLNLEAMIHQRMINQDRAVQVVSDALRRARSGVNNPNRPIGTFLFLGPTGVGKTELAKSVAATYFNGENNIIRVDMNELVGEGSAERLLVGVDEHGTGLLPQIRKQPFSVVLFDEIEKAHPRVLDLFLQMLDEGIMRDNQNREVSFRDAIIVATSNAGAQTIRAQIEAGHQLEEFERTFVDQLVSSGQFKPEFLNRFDEVVLFRPLNKTELLQVVDIIMAGINRNLARQKVTVRLTDAGKQWLVDNGYDARLGARPLRRMAQRSVENIVAKKILESSFTPGSELVLDVDDLQASQ